VKATVTCQSPLIVYDPANKELIHSPPNVTWDVQPCREGDLLNAMEVVRDGNAKVQFRKWLGKLRQAEEKAQAPLEIKIVNASELVPTKEIKISRDSDGRLTGATSQAVTS
jgi:hypothetical protein